MTHCRILNGQAMAEEQLAKLQGYLQKKIQPGVRVPALSTILVGDDPASHIYVRNKRKKAEAVGIKSNHHQLPENLSQAALTSLIKDLNQDASIDGILVQLPLPGHMDPAAVIETIDPNKDVDGFHPINLGNLFKGIFKVIPCTPRGCLHILEKAQVDLFGKQAVVVGRSMVVGNPMAQLLLRKNATITIAHRHTKNLAEITKHADVLVVAVGKAGLITEHHVKKGAVVIDVGINKDKNGKLCGDVDFAQVVHKASAITPVPGGVGPMTIAMLLQNTVELWEKRLGL